MDNEDIDVNEAESSTSNEVPETSDVAAPSSSAEGEQAEDQKAEASLSDIVAETVKDTLEGAPADEESPPSEEDQEPAAEAAEAPDEAEPQVDELDVDELDFSESELKALKDKTRTRFNELLAQRDAYKSKAGESEVIAKFMQENNISSDEMARMMGTLAHYQAGDYQGFLDGIQPLMDHAGTALGVNLPPDIQKRVDEGYVDAESAAEMASQRAMAEQQRLELARTQFNAQQTTHQVQADAMRNAVDTWEADIKASDVDYAQKEDQIRANARALMAQYGQPANAEQALQLSKDAYEMTNEFIKKAAPPPRAIKPGPQSATVPGAHPEPQSMLEAVRLGIRNANAGA